MNKLTIGSAFLVTLTLTVSGAWAKSPLVILPKHKSIDSQHIPARCKANKIVKGLANSAPTIVPGMDTLPSWQSQRANDISEKGQQALASGNLNGAETEFRNSLSLDTTNPSTLKGLAQTLELEGKNEQAISVYRYLLYPKQGWETSMEEDPILRMHFALLLVGDEQWAEAVSAYENTIGHISYGSSFPPLSVHFSPSVPQPALFQAMAHLVMGITYNGDLEHTQALAEYTAAVNAQPSLALAHYYYGQGLWRLGRREEAKAAYKKASELDDAVVKAAAEKVLKDVG